MRTIVIDVFLYYVLSSKCVVLIFVLVAAVLCPWLTLLVISPMSTIYIYIYKQTYDRQVKLKPKLDSNRQMTEMTRVLI